MTAQISELHEANRERLTMRISLPSNDRYHPSSSYVNRSWGLFSLACNVLQDLGKQTERDPDHSPWLN